MNGRVDAAVIMRLESRFIRFARLLHNAFTVNRNAVAAIVFAAELAALRTFHQVLPGWNCPDPFHSFPTGWTINRSKMQFDRGESAGLAQLDVDLPRQFGKRFIPRDLNFVFATPSRPRVKIGRRHNREMSLATKTLVLDLPPNCQPKRKSF
jgi:hypothetical protein